MSIPWSLAPRKGKYYGTVIVDSNGDEVLTLWSGDGNHEPSEREKEYFGEWTPEKWADYICDTHYETVSDYEAAKLIVETANRHGHY